MKPLVSNAADPKQIKNAEMKEKLAGDQASIDLATVLSTAQGRRLVWRMLEKCRTFESIWDNSAKIHFNAGQQDIGHWLMAEVVRAGEEFLFTMMKENKKEG